MWLERSYCIPNFNLKTTYLNQIKKDGVEYDKEILEIIQTKDKSKLYIPKNLILPSLNPNINLQEDFFFDSIYWLRYLKSDRCKSLDDLTWIDLYLISSNPFERYSARTLLSYYNDKDLYLKFGKIGKYLFPKNYSSKRTQLDGFVAFCLYPFGYFHVLDWNHPIKLQYHTSDIPLGQETIQTIYLKDINIKEHIMPVLKLGIQIESCWPLIKNKNSWLDFMNLINDNAEFLHNEYKKLNQTSFSSSEQKITISLPDSLTSYEQKYNVCLLCSNYRSSGDFSLCGHGTCMHCQALLCTAKCPFCPEHFTADNLNDDIVNMLNSKPSILFKDRIKDILELKLDRSFKFDWINHDVIIFT